MKMSMNFFKLVESTFDSKLFLQGFSIPTTEAEAHHSRLAASDKPSILLPTRT